MMDGSRSDKIEKGGVLRRCRMDNLRASERKEEEHPRW
jgi:hypothetical protein